MEQTEIITRIETLYKAEKSNKFILHLIRSYYQKDFPQIYIDDKDVVYSCCITKDILISGMAWQGKNTDTIMSAPAIDALRKFTDDNKDKDQFVKLACTINRTVANNSNPVYKRSLKENKIK